MSTAAAGRGLELPSTTIGKLAFVEIWPRLRRKLAGAHAPLRQTLWQFDLAGFGEVYLTEFRQALTAIKSARDPPFEKESLGRHPPIATVPHH